MSTNNTEGAIPEPEMQRIYKDAEDYLEVEKSKGLPARDWVRVGGAFCAGKISEYNRKLTETEAKATEIKPYIYSNLRGLSWFHYLHIQGGTGRKDGLGGQYTFYLTYLRPDQKEEIDAEALDYWCKERSIPCGIGDTIEEAYSDFKSQLKKTPLK